jgi:tripartite-type tricarboxylate transporter receptor subunit TctC
LFLLPGIASAHGSSIEITTLSTAPHRVTGGSVLLRVDVPGGLASKAKVKLNGKDVTNAFPAAGGNSRKSARHASAASAARAPSLPNVPTIAEAALPGFFSVAWFGVVAPAGTSDVIVRQLNAAFAGALKLPEVRKRFAEVGAEPVGGTTAETGAFIKDETERWRQVIKAANVTLD